MLSTSGRVTTLGHRDIVHGSRRAGEIDLPADIRPRDRRFIEETRRRLRRLPTPRQAKAKADRPFIDHPVASCPDAHSHVEASRKVDRLRQRLEERRCATRAAGVGLIEEFEAEQLAANDDLAGPVDSERLARLEAAVHELAAAAREAGGGTSGAPETTAPVNGGPGGAA